MERDVLLRIASQAQAGHANVQRSMGWVHIDDRCLLQQPGSSGGAAQASDANGSGVWWGGEGGERRV